MTQTERACVAGAVIGAAIGATVAYFYGTDDGARRREELARLAERVRFDIDDARQLWTRLQDVWAEYDRPAAARRPRLEGTRNWPPGGAA